MMPSAPCAAAAEREAMSTARKGAISAPTRDMALLQPSANVRAVVGYACAAGPG